MTLQELEARLAGVRAELTTNQDQQLGVVACQEALVAALRGNYGVGALLVDPQGTIVARGQNAVFSPYFRSDLHAEMVVMNIFEERHPEIDTMQGTRWSVRSSHVRCASPVSRLGECRQ